MREKEIENKLKNAVREKGGLCLKFVSPGYDGVPDRLILLPNSRMAFAELKAPGKKLRPLQERRKGQLEKLGFLVYCVDSKDEVLKIIKEIQEMGGNNNAIYTT